MSASSTRGWVLGLVLGLGSGTGAWLAVSHGQQEQARQLEQMAEELSSLRKAIKDLPPPPPPQRGGIAAGVPPSLASGEAKLTPTDLDALATRMVLQLKQAGALAPAQAASSREETPQRPRPLNPSQQQALSRAHVLVDRVVGVGRMTEEDLQEIRRELHTLDSPEQAQEVRRKLIIAINQNRLVPPDVPEPLP